MLEEVTRVIEELRPELRQDGGEVELVDVQGSDVFVRLKGHCIGCPMSALTVKQKLELALRRQVSGVERVRAVS
jgi:Fe-S cluster biogenesis protein NfuA